MTQGSTLGGREIKSNLMPVRVVYRSRPIQYPLIAAMNKCNAWERAGLDLTYMDFVYGPSESDPMLIDGKVDFIFGSHITPYLHRSKGVPMVYVGQVVNWCDEWLVSSKPIHNLADLSGKVIADESTTLPNHPFGNRLLYLKRGGLELSQVDFLETGRKSPAYLAVAEGKADAAIISPPHDNDARELGLHVVPLPWLPMIYATTLLTMWDRTQERPELVRRIIQAVRYGVRFFKTEKKQMEKLMEDTIGPELGIHKDTYLQSLYQRNCLLLDESLYPRVDAIENAFRIANMMQHDLHEKVNPMELWDVHFLREVEKIEKIR